MPSIAIIGCGLSGLTAIKSCSEENLDFICFEKSNNICGLWKYHGDSGDQDRASIMRQLVANTSKEMTAFSDFCPPEDFPNFMHNNKMSEYLELFFRRLCIKDKEIQNKVLFNKEVLRMDPNEDHSKTGRWRLTIKDLKTEEVAEQVFDGVMVCAGLNNRPKHVLFKDQNVFKGLIIHSKEYKNSFEFRDKTVLIVGIGNSAVDVATDLSLVARKVFLSTRSGSWITRRVGLGGRPLDQQFNSRLTHSLLKICPFRTSCFFGERFLSLSLDHSFFGLKPNHRVFSQHPTINDDLPNRLLAGFIQLKPDVTCFTPEGVLFKGETEETPIDVVIMATGYELHFPFLEHVLPLSKRDFSLYKHVFSPSLPHAHTLAVIGCVQPNGAIPPISELQSRWFCRLMRGNTCLPSEEVMRRHVAKRKEFIKKRYSNNWERHALQEDWISYCDSIALKVGCLPSIWKYFFTDFRLFSRLLFGPSLPYQYRLRGPNKCKESRELILSASKRTKQALNAINL